MSGFFAHFLTNWAIILLIVYFKWFFFFLYILDNCTLSDMSFAKVSPSLWLVFPFYWHWFLQNRRFWLQWTLKSESESHSVVSNSLRPHGLYSPWNSPGHNTGVDSLSLLQRIFPIQGLNPGLPQCRQADSLPAKPQGKPISYWSSVNFFLGASFV